MKRFPAPRKWTIGEIEAEAQFARELYAARRPSEGRDAYRVAYAEAVKDVADLLDESDDPVGLRNGRYLLLECKVSGSEVNSFKRLNHETVNKRDTWQQGFAAQAYTGAVLGGVFRPTNVLAAQERGVYIFWEHDLAPLGAFLDEVG